MEFLYSSFFQLLVFPVLCLVGTVLLKVSMRGPKSEPFKLEDLVVGVELIWLSLTIFIAGLADKASRFSERRMIVKKIHENIPQVSIERAESILGFQNQEESAINFLGSSGFIVFGIFFVAVAMTLAVRLFGWKDTGDPKLFVGVALPIVIGLASLGGVMQLLSVEL